MPGKLAGIIRAKHPGAYDDMDDATLEQSVLAKYPQYADLAKEEAPAPQATALGNMMAIRGGGGATSDAPEQKPGFLTGLGDSMFESAARPQSGMDFAGLIGAPLDATRAIGAKLAGRIVSAIPARTIANKTLKGASAVLESPLANMVSPRLQHVGKMADALADTIGTTAAKAAPVDEVLSQVSHGADQFTMPRTERVVDRVTKAAQEHGNPTPPPRGRIRTTRAQAEPAPAAQSAPEAAATTQSAQAAAQELPESWKALTEGASELRQPRVDIGAQKVGRQAGLTKEEVRMQTGPILGEALGEASPILPEKALQKIIDTMKALPKEGSARADYVARATSGKSQWQIENIRRTLEHLGLLVAAPVAGATVHDILAERMRRGYDR